MNNLAILHEVGHGVPRDLALASKLYAMAAETGHPSAIANLGYLKMVQQDFVQAKALLREAADRGSIEALYSLGVLHLMLHEQTHDEDEWEHAVRYLRLAA